MTTTLMSLVESVVFIPGLVSDFRVWKHVAGDLGLPFKVADVSQDSSIVAMADRALADNPGAHLVVGHSMGGRVAMEMARQAPAQVTALVLANTGHSGKKPGEEAKRQAKIDLAHTDMKALAAEWLPPMLAPGREEDSLLMADLREMVLAAGPDVHERQIKALVGRPDAGAYLPNLSMPMLLLTGREDSWSPPAQHEQIRDLASNAVLEIISDAGHFMPFEQPEATARAIRSWLLNEKA